MMVLNLHSSIFVGSPVSVRLSELAQPLKHDAVKFGRFIGILAYTGDDVWSNDEELTPLFAVPLIVTDVHRIAIALKVSYYDTGRVHHLDGSLSIVTSILPAHTRAPTAVVIAHSHIVKRMNGDTKLTIKLLLVKALRMCYSELLIACEIKFSCDFTKHLTCLTAGIDIDNVSFLIAKSDGRTIIYIGCKGIGVEIRGLVERFRQERGVMQAEFVIISGEMALMADLKK
jgi:hypothetical protein